MARDTQLASSGSLDVAERCRSDSKAVINRSLPRAVSAPASVETAFAAVAESRDRLQSGGRREASKRPALSLPWPSRHGSDCPWLLLSWANGI
jgi:hypothetical protein